MTEPLTDQQLDEIEQRATSEHLTPGPWDLAYEACDCGGDYPCGHGPYVTGVITPVPTSIAADRCKRTGEEPRDYDFHRGEVGDFTESDWALMVAAREDVPALLAEIRRLRAESTELRAENAKLIRWHREDEKALAEMRSTIEYQRAEQAAALRPDTPRLCACGHSNRAHTAPAPHSCFAHGQTCPCPAYRQLPHDEAVEQLERNRKAAEERAAAVAVVEAGDPT